MSQMNRTKWFETLALLVVMTFVSYGIMCKLSPKKPEGKKGTATPASLENRSERNTTPTIAEEPPKTPEEEAAAEVAVDYQLLSEKTLFRNTRAEADNESAISTEKANEEQANQEFELVGIARIGKKDAAIPVAIIANVQGTRRGTSTRTGAPGRGQAGGRPTTTANRNAAATQQPAAGTKATQKIYKVGDMIGTSGYKLKEIVVAEDKVILTRGGADVTLKIDVLNARNSVRRETVQKAELAQRTQLQNKQTKNAATGTPSPQGTTANNGRMTAEQQRAAIRAQVLARQQAARSVAPGGTVTTTGGNRTAVPSLPATAPRTLPATSATPAAGSGNKNGTGNSHLIQSRFQNH